jgi:hypothetical protein
MSTRTGIDTQSQVELAELGERDSGLRAEAQLEEDPKLKPQEFKGRQVAMMAFGTQPCDYSDNDEGQQSGAAFGSSLGKPCSLGVRHRFGLVLCRWALFNTPSW